MAVIDVQVHAYERNHPGRPWVGQLHGPQSATGEEMIAAMDAVGVDGCNHRLDFQPLPLRSRATRSRSMPSIRRGFAL